MKYMNITGLLVALFTCLLLMACASTTPNKTGLLASIGSDNMGLISPDTGLIAGPEPSDLVSSEADDEMIDGGIVSEPAADIRRKVRYKVRGRHYEVFVSNKNFQELGKASWYGPGFHGKLTANGEKYDMYALTAAHKTLPFNSRVIVTNLANKKQVVVRINDRGPFHGGRIIDLSKMAAKKIDMLKSGKAQVHLKIQE